MLKVGFILFIGLLLGCQRQTCDPKTSVLIPLDFNSSRYNLALARMINSSDSTHLKITFESYGKEDHTHFITVRISSDEGCALGRFAMKEENVWPEVVESEGRGYRGAELVGFEFTMMDSSAANSLCCTAISAVVD